MLKHLCLALGLAGLAAPALAQQFTTAAEVRPILQATRANWVAVREYEGQDLVYFTHLLSWRCGLMGIKFGLNGAEATQFFPAEPCHDGTAQPNALSSEAHFPYFTMPLGSVQSLSVTIIYDDGVEESASFERAQVLMP
ncbi:MAG: hypothetical protein R3D84_08660 [Paracoccaceae bacterium]